MSCELNVERRRVESRKQVGNSRSSRGWDYLCISDFFFGIDEQNVAGDGVHDETIRNRCANIASAEYGNGGSRFGV